MSYETTHALTINNNKRENNEEFVDQDGQACDYGTAKKIDSHNILLDVQRQ